MGGKRSLICGKLTLRVVPSVACAPGGQLRVLADSRELGRGSFTWLNLNDVLREVVERARPLARGGSVVTLSDPSGDRLYVSGDALALRRAFARLVCNVVCHGASGSEFMLSCNYRNTAMEVSIVNQRPERCLDRLLEWGDAMKGGWRMGRRLQAGGGLELSRPLSSSMVDILRSREGVSGS